MGILEFILDKLSEIKAGDRQVVAQKRSRKNTVFPEPEVTE